MTKIFNKDIPRYLIHDFTWEKIDDTQFLVLKIPFSHQSDIDKEFIENDIMSDL